MVRGDNMNLYNYDWNLASLYAMKTAMLHTDGSRYLAEGVYISYIYIYMHSFNKEKSEVAVAADSIAFQSKEIHEYAYFKGGWIIITLDYLKKLPYLAFLFDSNEKTQVMLYGGAKK